MLFLRHTSVIVAVLFHTVNPSAMAHDNHTQSKLQRLELAHADEGQLADIRRSDALTAESKDLENGYFLSVGLVGSVAGVSLSTVAAYFVSKTHAYARHRIAQD